MEATEGKAAAEEHGTKSVKKARRQMFTFIASAVIAIFAIWLTVYVGRVFEGHHEQQQTIPTQQQVAAAPAPAEPPDQVCGSGEQADCVCRGEGRVTRYLEPGETVLVKAYDGNLMQITFDPPPSPDTFGYRDSVDEGDWVTNNTTNLQVHTTYEVQNFSKRVLPLRCHYH